MPEELKPCPFCGGEARTIGCPQVNEVFVECRSCGVMTGAKLSRGQVILDWNRRAQQPSKPLTVDDYISRKKLLTELRKYDELCKDYCQGLRIDEIIDIVKMMSDPPEAGEKG